MRPDLQSGAFGRFAIPAQKVPARSWNRTNVVGNPDTLPLSYTRLSLGLRPVFPGCPLTRQDLNLHGLDSFHQGLKPESNRLRHACF